MGTIVCYNRESQIIRLVLYCFVYTRIYIYVCSIDLLNSSYSFGRTSDCDVIITKDSIPENKYAAISKKHFEIVKEDGMPAVLIDHSKNGTFINGKPVGRNNKHILQNEDQISVGFVSLKGFKCITNLENKIH